MSESKGMMERRFLCDEEASVAGEGAAPARVLVCCAWVDDTDWRWVAPLLRGRFEWNFYFPAGEKPLERPITRPDLAGMRACWHSVRAAKRKRADVLFTHGPPLAFWTAAFAVLLRCGAALVAYSFNYSALPTGVHRWLLSLAFRRVQRFVVYSEVERSIYSRHFGIPIDKIDRVLWGVQPPEEEGAGDRLEPGEYICAIGGNARDYHSLAAAMALLPDIPLVLVSRSQNVDGLQFPPNVRVHLDVPLPMAMNVLSHSRFMVLPLIDAQVPCGHVTLVAAMHLGKACIVTESAGVRDYVRDGQNALTVPAGSARDLAAVIQRLWEDRAFCSRLATHAKSFAGENLSEENHVRYLKRYLSEKGLLELERRGAPRG